MSGKAYLKWLVGHNCEPLADRFGDPQPRTYDWTVAGAWIEEGNHACPLVCAIVNDMTGQTKTLHFILLVFMPYVDLSPRGTSPDERDVITPPATPIAGLKARLGLNRGRQ